MMAWSERPREIQSLLNPAFCAQLLWRTARTLAVSDSSRSGLDFSLVFLVLPMCLHKEIRSALPGNVSTSMAVWVLRTPLAPAILADRAIALVSTTKEALVFGGIYGLLRFDGTTLVSNGDWAPDFPKAKFQSDEVRLCTRAAEFLGRWFARTGNAETVLAILGVQP